MEEETQTIDIGDVKEMKDAGSVYELAYLFVPTVPEEGVPALYTELKDRLVKDGAVIISEDHAKLMPLAYEMRRVVANKSERFNEGYFGWMKFDFAPEHLAALNTDLLRNEKLIRFMVIKTVRESTLAPKKMFARTDTARKRYTPKKEEAAATPINKEELDREIDALITPDTIPETPKEVVE